MTVTGAKADVYWGYALAATLTSWTRDKREFTATVVSQDEFRMTQQPLQIIVVTAVGRWVWPVTSLTVDGASLRAEVA